MGNRRIAIIGAGRLGSALALGFSKNSAVVVSDPDKGKLKALELRNSRISAARSNQEAISGCGIVVLALKPDMVCAGVRALLPEISEKLVVSCAAMVSIGEIEKCGAMKVMRVMPNVCAEVGEGFFACAPGKGLTEDETKMLIGLFSDLGICERMEERDVEAITGVSGSGPAFFAYFAKSVFRSALKAGLPEKEARVAVAQTMLGTAELLLAGRDFDEIISRVTSPGGTTEQGLKMLEQGNVSGRIEEAVSGAIKKAREKI
ncbi:MAG: pyrroline-5-carboxylate reductase [Candidatus Micrarchaeia archaeon]